MDDNLREMGVGDLAVPKEMRRMGEAFYGRAQAYRAALAAGDDAAAGGRRWRAMSMAGVRAAAAPRRLAAYMREAVRDLAAQDSRGASPPAHVRFPGPGDPETTI